jgi:integrase
VVETDLGGETYVQVKRCLARCTVRAVADRHIPHNPCHGVRIITHRAAGRPHATTAQVNETASRVDRHSDHTLIITAAYTGMRWGELAGLARANTHLDDGLLVVHPKVGALHEIAGDLYLGPPTPPATSTSHRSSSRN